MDGKKVNEVLFKQFCEGDLQTTKLYEDGQHNFKHYSKCIATSNEMPNIKIDTGVKRRFVGYTHKSTFVDSKKEVNEKNNIYLKDKNLLQNIKEKGLLIAWFDILAMNCSKWLNGEKVTLTDNFIETKDTVVSSNDIFQDFIDSKLIITKDAENRIGKNEMHKKFSRTYPDRHLSVLQVISSLKDHKVQYSGTFRVKNAADCLRV